MRAVLPIHLLDVDQSKVRLVDERGGLERVPRAFASHAGRRDPVKLSFERRDEARQNCFIATPSRQQQGGFIGNRSQ